MTRNRPTDADYYHARAIGGDDDAQRVGWRDRLAQQRRFAALAELLPKDRTVAFTINDIGCGLGDFARYLRDAGFVAHRYAGFDHSADMIAGAKARDGNSGDCFVLTGEQTAFPVADYSIASGIFNLRFEAHDAAWLQFIHETLQAINVASARGFAFNALTRYSDTDHMRPELYYADPCALFDHCKRRFSRNVALLHDYDEYDFTILVRKAG